MDCWVQTHALNSANHLGNLALVDGSQSSLLGVLDLAGAGRELLNKSKVLHNSLVPTVPVRCPC